MLLSERLREKEQVVIEKKDLGIIRFIKTPTGDAPEEIRKKWIGIEVACLFFDPTDDDSVDVVTKQKAEVIPVFVVLQSEAIDALNAVSPEAAQYWKKLGYPQDENGLFSFDAESAEIVKPVWNRDEFLSKLPKICAMFPPDRLN